MADLSKDDLEYSKFRTALEGTRLTKEQAQKIARKVRTHKDDLPCRLLLLGYYSGAQFHSGAEQKARSRHVLWMIKNHPSDPIAGGHWCMLSYGEISDHDALREAKDLWTKQVETFPRNAQVLANAASFFHSLHEDDTAEACLQKAKQVDPENPKWPEKLSQFFELKRGFAPKKKKPMFAQKALVEAEFAFELEESTYGKLLMLDDLAWISYKAGDQSKAEGYAQSILDLAEKTAKAKHDGFPANSLHNAYLVLGSIALDNKNTQLAIDNLLRSVTVPKQSSGNTLIPDMSLARSHPGVIKNQFLL